MEEPELKLELESPLLPKLGDEMPKPDRPLLPRSEELPKALLPRAEPVKPVPPMVELEKLLSLEALFTPFELPEKETEVAGPEVTDPWKVVTGVPLDPPMAAAIAELMDGPRELITFEIRASSLPNPLVGAAATASAQASIQRSFAISPGGWVVGESPC